MSIVLCGLMGLSGKCLDVINSVSISVPTTSCVILSFMSLTSYDVWPSFVSHISGLGQCYNHCQMFLVTITVCHFEMVYQSLFFDVCIYGVLVNYEIPYKVAWCDLNVLLHWQKSPARPMLFYSTNYWDQFRVQFVM